jgi:hypothetical protein
LDAEGDNKKARLPEASEFIRESCAPVQRPKQDNPHLQCCISRKGREQNQQGFAAGYFQQTDYEPWPSLASTAVSQRSNYEG